VALSIEVARLTLTGRPKPLALADLTVVQDGRKVLTVNGFKLMPGEGKPWLAVPQTPRRDNPEKREDRFAWADKALEAAAFNVVLAAYQDATRMEAEGLGGPR